MPFPWPLPSQRVLQPGDIILDEISVSYGGYSGQICSPIALGEPTQEYQDLFAIAHRTYTRIAAVLKPGNSEEAVWEAASPMVEAGRKVQAALVHGWTEKVENPRVGLPHAPPWPLRGIRFRAGETLMIEPNPCTPNLLKGTFLGGRHLVTPEGARSLQKYPVEFVVKPI
jgi:methionine aminopeptidase